MTLFAAISLFSGLFCFFVGNFVYFQSRKRLLHKLFFGICLINAYWGFTEFMLRQADHASAAFFWAKAGSFCLFALPVAVHFALVFTERSRIVQKGWVLLVLYSSILISSLVMLFTDFVISGVNEMYWGYSIVISPPSLIRNAVLLWAMALGLVAVILTVSYYLKIRNPKEKKQAYYVALGFLFPVVIANLSQVLSPLLHLPIPESSVFGAALQEALIGYAIWKYDLFALNPVTAAENIVDTMPDLLILLRPDGKIVSINRAVTKVLGFDEEELIRQPVTRVMPEHMSRRILEGGEDRKKRRTVPSRVQTRR